MLTFATRTPPRVEGGQRIVPAKFLGKIYAFMAKVCRNKFTLQGRDTPVSTAGQGVKVGPQASSSCDRSSSLAGNLASGEFRATRNTHVCSQVADVFCYVCGNFEVLKYCEKISEAYKDLFLNVLT